jgi:SAM-dependent methyltransferase
VEDRPDEIAPDGSPVAVYLAVPAEYGFEPLLEVVAPGQTVLDLGCGTGRLANLLAGRGHEVTGVDESPAMLRHLDPRVTTVEGRIEHLDLAGRFDVVVLASHLVNTADEQVRHGLLLAAARHLAPDGIVLLQHHDTDLGAHTDHRVGTIGPVSVEHRVLARDGPVFDAEVTYRLRDRRWVQRYRSELLDGAALTRSLALAGLAPDLWLSPTWTAACPASGVGRAGPRLPTEPRRRMVGNGGEREARDDRRDALGAAQRRRP